MSEDYSKGGKKSDVYDEISEALGQAIVKILTEGAKFLYNTVKNLFNSRNSSKVNSKIDDQMLKKRVHRSNPYGIAYSYKYRADIDFRFVDLNRHTLVCGTTGSGKNVTLDVIIENRLKSGLPVVFIDPKGDAEALKKFKKMNNFYNRKCYIFSEIYDDSDKCNPILEGEVSTIVNRLFSIFDWGEPYYRDTNYNALEKAVAALKEEGTPVTLKKIHSHIETHLKTAETLNILNKISKINTSSFGKLLSASSNAVTFSKLREEGASIYIGLSTLGFPEVSQSIGKLFVYELMYHSYKTFADFIHNKPLQNPFTVVIDELGSVVTPDFISLINKCRGAGVGVCVSFQLLADLKSIHETFAEQLVGNMNNFFIGHCHLPDEAEYWANTIGTYMTKKETNVTENGEILERGSVRDTQEFLVHPSLFKNLKVGQFVISSFLPRKYLDLVQMHKKEFLGMSSQSLPVRAPRKSDHQTSPQDEKYTTYGSKEMSEKGIQKLRDQFKADQKTAENLNTRTDYITREYKNEQMDKTEGDRFKSSFRVENLRNERVKRGFKL